MKVVDTPTLISLCTRARAKGYNRLMSKAAEKQLDPSGQHILSQPMIHGDVQCVCVRCLVVMCKMKDQDEPYQGNLDFDIADWNRLPEHEPTD